MASALWTLETWWRHATVTPLPADEILLAGLITAASAEFTNAALKFFVYEKEMRKAAAANALSTAGSLSLEAVSRK